MESGRSRRATGPTPGRVDSPPGRTLYLVMTRHGLCGRCAGFPPWEGMSPAGQATFQLAADEFLSYIAQAERLSEDKPPFGELPEGIDDITFPSVFDDPGNDTLTPTGTMQMLRQHEAGLAEHSRRLDGFRKILSVVKARLTNQDTWLQALQVDVDTLETRLTRLEGDKADGAGGS